MKVVGFVGWSGSGKTTLMERVVAEFARRGVSVSTIKHTHHDIELDKPGKDSFRHRMAGAKEAMLAGPRRWTLIHEHAHDPDGPAERRPLTELLRSMAPVDLVIVEGFKFDPIPRIEVFRPALGKPALYADEQEVVAVATDAPLNGAPVPVLDLNDPASIARFIAETLDLPFADGAE